MGTTSTPRCLRVGAALSLLSLVSIVSSTLAIGQDGGGAGPRGRRGPPVPTTALAVGTIHPVDAPAIANGVIVMQGARILAMGAADQVEIPADATRIDMPGAHAYPGLVDGLSAAFSTSDVLSNGATDAGTDFAEALDGFEPRSRELLAAGVTTVYVSNRGGATWRGIGAVVRPGDEGYTQFRDPVAGALHVRMTAGAERSHPLERGKSLAQVGDAFKGLDDYEKARTEFDEKVAEYDKEWKKYIEFHRKKNGKDVPADAKPTDAKPADGASEGAKSGEQGKGDAAADGTAGPAQDGETPRRRGPRSGRGQRPPRDGAAPTGDAAGATSKPATEAAAPADAKAAAAGEAPKRPEYPKRPTVDPAKDALLELTAGKRTLRAEAHRVDEIRAALDLKRTRSLDTMVLEGASAAAPLAAEIAAAGVPVVLTELMRDPDAPDDFVDAGTVRALAEADVTIAIGSGADVRRARFLPLLAAQAAARGLDEQRAIRAITLTPAELLGVADRVGSLREGKVADIVVTSGPLLSSDSRILRVFAGGRPVYEAQ